jgi:hypothetical protein
MNLETKQALGLISFHHRQHVCAVRRLSFRAQLTQLVPLLLLLGTYTDQRQRHVYMFCRNSKALLISWHRNRTDRVVKPSTQGVDRGRADMQSQPSGAGGNLHGRPAGQFAEINGGRH